MSWHISRYHFMEKLAVTDPTISALNIYETCKYWAVQTIIAVNRFLECIEILIRGMSLFESELIRAGC